MQTTEWLDYKTYRDLETELREWERNFNASSQEQEMQGLELIEKIRQVLTAHLKKSKKSKNELINRLRLCLADALITFHVNYQSVFRSQRRVTAFKDFSEALKILDEVKAPLPESTDNGKEVMADGKLAFVFWQKHVLTGLALYEFSRLRRIYYDVPGALTTARIAVEHFKQAGYGTTTQLNLVRNTLSYTYLRRGFRNLATEVAQGDLQNRLSDGKSAYIGMGKDILAQSLIDSNYTLIEAFQLSLEGLQDLTRHFDTEQKDEITNYNLLQIHSAEFARRLARNYPRAEITGVCEVFDYSIKTLLEAVAFIESTKNKSRVWLAYNGLGSAYRAYGRALQEQIKLHKFWLTTKNSLYKEKIEKLERLRFGQLGLIQKRDNQQRDNNEGVSLDKAPALYFEQATEWLLKALATSRYRFNTEPAFNAPFPDTAWDDQIDTLQDLFQLAAYYQTYLDQNVLPTPPESIKELGLAQELSLDYLKSACENLLEAIRGQAGVKAQECYDLASSKSEKDLLKSILDAINNKQELDIDMEKITQVSFSLPLIQLRGLIYGYYEYKGRNEMQLADWTWSKYFSSLQKKNPDVAILEENIRHRIEALDWFAKFQPSFMVKDGSYRDYNQSLRFVTWLEFRVNGQLTDYRSRAACKRILSEMATGGQDSKKPPRWENLSKGAQVFLQMVDLGEEIGLSLEPWRQSTNRKG